MKILDLAAKLQGLGLNDKEARVYVAALFLGPSPVQKIAEQADINRATAYVILDQLASYGLVSESTERKKTVYIAEGPEAIERWLGNQERAIRAKREELNDVKSELRQIDRSADAVTPQVRFFRGPDIGVMNGYLRRNAKVGSTIYAFTNIDEVLRNNPGVLTANPKARLKKKLNSKLIYSYSAGDIPSDPKLLRETEKIDEPIAAEINLYEVSMDITTYGADERVAVVIESAPITKAMRQLFDMAWKNNVTKS